MRGGRAEAYWREVGLGEVSARAYPYANASSGLLLTCWIGWTACVERYFDEPAAPAPRELLALVESLVGGGEPPRVRHPLAAALADLWRDTSRLMPASRGRPRGLHPRLRRRIPGKRLYRTRKGLLRATEAYCPHLGAHLGVGGTVEGENLICPFHRFAYAPDGTCVRTAYGKRPPKARLRQLEVREINGGIIFAWYDHDGAGPQWELPEVDLTGYSPLVHITVEMPTHPQEIGENTVDEGHFPVMHKSPISRSARTPSTGTSSASTSRCASRSLIRPARP
ncbi:Rieske 2Fe-2S domain-containing protein [Streptomyces europaeiscabiei]|uniref:Rieske 2Fe-2S domain-containing protein n=1 Tax=Streptomyces europaeiscabiei TaxID=146819 RepID=UPI0038F7F27A